MYKQFFSIIILLFLLAACTDSSDNAGRVADLDGDGIADTLDEDRDGDGVNNTQDAFPDNAAETSDLDGDGVGDNTDPDIDGDGISNEEDAQPTVPDVAPEPIPSPESPPEPPSGPPSEPPSGPDVTEADRDGDGVPNNQDTWPDDATRSKLPAVTGLEVSLQTTDARLQWNTLSENTPGAELVAGYNLYRNRVADNTWIKQNSALLNTPRYTDRTLVAGAGYRYKVVAVDNNAIEGQSSEVVELFAAFNITPVQDFTVALLNSAQSNTQPATQSKVQNRTQRASVVQSPTLQLNWQAIAGMRYQVYRSFNGAIPGFLTAVDTNQYTEGNLASQSFVTYQVASLAQYTNPFSGESVEVRGPLTEEKSLVLRDVPLILRINNAHKTPDGGLEITEFAVLEGRAQINGLYRNATTGVTITATTIINNQPVSISQITRSGQFTLALPATQRLSWQITVSENTAQNASATIELSVVPDSAPPLISIDGAATRSTPQAQITLLGNVSDAGSGIQSVILQNNRFNGISLSAAITGQRFNIEVPLKVGSNIITATATDQLGNASQVSITVNRDIAAAPQIEISSPRTGSTTRNSQINISGLIYSSQASDALRISLGNQQIFASATARPGIHSFSFNNINLQIGVNTFSVNVDSPLGDDQAPLQITYTQPTNQQAGAPTISVSSPAAATVTGANAVIIRGTVSSASSRIDNIQVNSTLVASSSTQSTLAFEYRLDLSAVADGPQAVNILATDTDGLSTTFVYSISKDTRPPQIALSDSSLLASPQVNTVRSNPYTLSGTVTDNNIAGLDINGQAVDLLPAAVAGSYTFDASISLPSQQNQTLILTARDQAGQQAQQTLIVFADVGVGIDIIAPLDNADISLSFTGQGATYPLGITARLTGWQADQQVSVVHEQDAPQVMTVNNGTAQHTLAIPLTEGAHKLKIQVADSTGALLSEASVTVNLINAEQIPLQLTSSTPANESTTAEPHLPISLFFNRPIDRSLLQVDVYETYSGQNYDLAALEGKSALENQQVELINVDRSHEVVPGGLSFFPQDTLVSFNPAREFAYGATVFVDVTYNKQLLSQLSYTVRELPTFAQGTVVASNQIPVEGIEVSIPELGRTAITNDNGNFGFGFGDSAKNALPAGRYKMLINAGLKDRRYGVLERWLNIEKGRINKLPTSQLQVLFENAPFSRINSGSSVSLFEGELKIDLSQATLRFPGVVDQQQNGQQGRQQGDVHVQFIEYGNLPYGSLSAAIPHWMYGIQPMGIKVSGLVGLDITMPTLNDSYDYIPQDGTLVVLLGYNSDAELLMPVGVGSIQNRHVISQLDVQLDELSYVGYALVLPAQQALLQNYADGNIGLEELKAGLNP